MNAKPHADRAMPLPKGGRRALLGSFSVCAAVLALRSFLVVQIQKPKSKNFTAIDLHLVIT
jgi:hypothetical protein